MREKERKRKREKEKKRERERYKWGACKEGAVREALQSERRETQGY